MITHDSDFCACQKGSSSDHAGCDLALWWQENYEAQDLNMHIFIHMPRPHSSKYFFMYTCVVHDIVKSLLHEKFTSKTNPNLGEAIPMPSQAPIYNM